MQNSIYNSKKYIKIININHNFKIKNQVKINKIYLMMSGKNNNY